MHFWLFMTLELRIWFLLFFASQGPVYLDFMKNNVSMVQWSCLSTIYGSIPVEDSLELIDKFCYVFSSTL